MKYIKIGKIKITTRTKSGYLLSALPNTTVGTMKYKKTEYIDTDGAEYTEMLYQPRTLTVNGYIMARSNSEYRNHKKILLRELNSKELQAMEFFDGEDKYIAKVFVDGTVNIGKEINRMVAPFSFNLIIPDFFFKAKNATVQALYSRKDLIKGSFDIPKEGLVFTLRTNKAVILNNGGVETYPMLKLKCVEEKTEKGVEIHNNTTGEYIKLNYQLTVGEVVSIDCEHIAVNSSINGNIINTVTPDSTFFRYKKGNTEVEVKTNGVTVMSSFNELYTGV